MFKAINPLEFYIVIPDTCRVSQLNALRVLLVDDDPNQLEIINLSMGGEDQSFHLETARSADKALELLKEKQFDCIVSDYQMPRMNGVEFCEKLRGEGYEDSFILFIMIF